MTILISFHQSCYRNFKTYYQEKMQAEWVIVDHATLHHGGRTAQLIAAAGAQVVYLPPYSPDRNRIEKV